MVRRLQITSPFAALPLAWQRSINRHWQGGGGRIYFPHLCPPSQQQTDPLHWVDRPTSSFNFSSSVPSYVGTSTNEPRPLPLSSTNEERWFTAGSFVFVHGQPQQFFSLSEDQVVSTSPARPRLSVQRMVHSHPSQRQLLGSSLARRPPGHGAYATITTEGTSSYQESRPRRTSLQELEMGRGQIVGGQAPLQTGRGPTMPP